MKKLKQIIAAAVLALTTVATQAAIINVSGSINSSTTWSRGNTYILLDKVFVKNNAVLTIQSGTVIKGDQTTKGALIITRGAKINAIGTETQPIVFTSSAPAGSRNYGDWGGVIILGRATINTPTGLAIIEGGFTSPDGEYGGGASPDDNDNSGTLKYVRIEYCGIAFQPNSEINGLTLGGVGRGTVLENIQVSYSGDDAFEFFGGTVNAKNLIAYLAIDDDFDTDFGYRGKLQFLFSLRDPNVADISGSNGFESDNDGTGTGNTPITNPWFSNVTLVGPVNGGSVNANYKRGNHFRRNTATSLYNSIVIGWPVGLLIDGTPTEGQAAGNNLQYQNNIIGGCTTPLSVNAGSTFDINAYFTSQGGNTQHANNSDVQLADAFNLSNPNPLPQAGSPALSGASFSNSRLTDPFFTAVSYRGAFGTTNWTKCWAEWDPQNQPYFSSTAINLAPDVSIAITSGTNPHCTGVNLTLSATPSVGLAFQWYKGTALLNGATNFQYTTSVGGGHKVEATNARGCKKTSTSITITVNAAPSVTVSNNDLSLCVNNPVTLAASSATATGYQWQLNSVDIGGATASNYNATAAGTYRVIASNANGCTKVSSNKVVKSTITKPVVTVNGSSTICAPQTTQLTTNPVAGLTYQWQIQNGSAYSNISGATGSNYTVTASGTYRIRVFSSLGCNAVVSLNTVISDGCRFSSDIESGMASKISFATIYPNPMGNKAVIELDLLKDSEVEVGIYDMTGKLVMVVANGSFNEGINELTFSSASLQNGIYVARITVNGILAETIKLSVNK